MNRGLCSIGGEVITYVVSSSFIFYTCAGRMACLDDERKSGGKERKGEGGKGVNKPRPLLSGLLP